MMKLPPDTDLQIVSEEEKIDHDAPPSNNTVTKSDVDEETEKFLYDNDLEMGVRPYPSVQPNNKLGDEMKSEEETEEGEYTHVLVPYPGYDHNGTKVKNLEDVVEEKKKLRHKLFSRLSKNREEPEKKEEDNEDDKELSDNEEEEIEEKRTDKRAVPIFCAVCLMECSTTERITWSSNSECSHVFHEDCVLQWLVALGRKRSKRQSFARHSHPSDRKLLDFDLACPCCRQEFISKSLVLAPEAGDENV